MKDNIVLMVEEQCVEKKVGKKLLFILVRDTHMFLLINWHMLVSSTDIFITLNCHYRWPKKWLPYLAVHGSAEPCCAVTQRPHHLGC